MGHDVFLGLSTLRREKETDDISKVPRRHPALLDSFFTDYTGLLALTLVLVKMTHVIVSLPPNATGSPPWGNGEPPWGSGLPPWGSGRPPWVTAMATATLTPSLPTSSPSSVSSVVCLLLTTAASATSGDHPTSVSEHGEGSHISSFPGALIQGPSSNDINLLIGVPCLFLAVCTAAVIGRFCARHMARLRLEADDWMALVALVRLCCRRKLRKCYR